MSPVGRNRSRRPRPTRAAAVALGLLGCALVASPATAAGFTKTTYEVPVTQPDELGGQVSIETDVYLPSRQAPASGRPLIEIFHGGGSNKDNGFDASHAERFARRGYAVILYSARGHGNSGGQTSVIGPKEIRDLFDVTAWALGIGGRDEPEHPDFQIDPRRIGLTGYSQGGLHTNLGQVWTRAASLNPYGIRFRALEPANTPDLTFRALVEHGVLKLSFGVALLGTYAQGAEGQIAPVVHKWVATAAADQPRLYGFRVCDSTPHDTATSTMKQDLAARSPGCFLERMTPPSLWAQSFDDTLFTADMGISMWRKMPSRSRNRLYLTMGGHAAPSADPAVEEDKLRAQLAFFDHHLRGRPLSGPDVVYWTRDPRVAVPGSPYRYPEDAWYRQTSNRWSPPGTEEVRYRLGADGRAVRGDAQEGSMQLSPFAEDEANDPVASAAISATPLGTSPVPSAVPATSSPGFVAGFRTGAFVADREMSGAPTAKLRWTPASPDTQLVLKVFDEAPDGRLTLITRGVRGIRNADPGEPRTVRIRAQTFSSLIPEGHRILAWVMAGDALFYKPYAGSAGGALRAGDASTLTLPLRRPR